VTGGGLVATNVIPPQTQAAGTASGQGGTANVGVLLQQNAATLHHPAPARMPPMTPTPRADPQGGFSVKQ